MNQVSENIDKIDTNKDEIKKDTQKVEKEKFNYKEFHNRMNIIKDMLSYVVGGVDIDSRISPILDPKKFKTTSNITRGEVSMVISLLTFAKISPEETLPVLEFCEDYMNTKLSEGGFGIDKVIELIRASTQETAISTSYSPEKPTEGMKKKEGEKKT